MPEAICTKCGTPFVYERVRGGRKNCDACSHRDQARRYKQRHPHRVKESHRKWREANPEKAAAATRRWAERNADYLRDQSQRAWANPEVRARKQASYRAWAERNRKLLSERASEWQRRNPDKVRARELRRKARLVGAAVVDFTDADWRELLAEHADSCFYCGVKNVFLEREHVVPLSRGGDHTKSNIVPACGPCNRRKWTLTGGEFRDRMGDRASQG